MVDTAQIERYVSNLDEAERIGLKKGIAMGISVALLWGFLMIAYGAGMKFGGYLIIEDRQVRSQGACVVKIALLTDCVAS